MAGILFGKTTLFTKLLIYDLQLYFTYCSFNYTQINGSKKAIMCVGVRNVVTKKMKQTNNSIAYNSFKLHTFLANR